MKNALLSRCTAPQVDHCSTQLKPSTKNSAGSSPRVAVVRPLVYGEGTSPLSRLGSGVFL